MKYRLRCILLITILMAPLAATAATANYRGRCAIIFEVQTTMKNFPGTAACEPFEITATDDMVEIPVIAVKVATMDTGNNRRDNAMREMLDHPIFPLITGNPESFTPNGLVTSAHHLVQPPDELTFALTIRDITRRITTTVTQPQIDASTIAATLAFDLALSSFELEPPSFLGIFRVQDTVKVRVTISLDRNPASSSMPPAQE